MSNQHESKSVFTTDEDSKFIDKRRINTKSDLIEITEDKLENILLKHLEKISIRKAWVVPLSIFITVLLANLTSTFTKKFGISGEIWEALYLLLSIGSGVWLLVSLLRAFATKEKGTIPELVAVIKNSESQN